MAAEIKKLEAAYKKCRADSKDCTVQNWTKLNKRINYFRHDTFEGFALLLEEVASLKNDGVKGKKIEDFAKQSKEVVGLLKHISWHQGKQLDAWIELEELEKSAIASGNDLKKMADDIAKDLKKLPKGTKPDPDILKLEKQIDTDLKDIKAFCQKVKMVPSFLRDPSREFDSEVKKIMNAKPAKSKYGKVSEDMLDLKILKEKRTKCTKAQRAVKALADLTGKYAKAGDLKRMDSAFLECTNQLQDILDIEHEYSLVKKKWQKDIKKSKNEKMIEGAIKVFKNAKKQAEKQHQETEAVVKKIAR